MEEFYVAKFLTLNTHSWLGEDPKWALETLGKQILKADYDVIAFTRDQSTDRFSESFKHTIYVKKSTSVT